MLPGLRTTMFGRFTGLSFLLGTLAFGAGAEQFAWIRSTVGVALVMVFMFFFPIHEHHVMDGEPATTPDGSYLQLTERKARPCASRTSWSAIS